MWYLIFSYIKHWNCTVKLNKEDQFIYLNITNISNEYVLTSKHWNTYNEKHKTDSMSLFVIILMAYNPHSLQFQLPEKKKKGKK